MRTTLGRLALALVLALAFAAGTPARADDDAKPLSAAEQAYKDAWWAETGGGDLNAALALYEKAAAAEGPAGVRAKALYRRALIQQRIGKTQDAIQTLERLAKEHPAEAEVQSDARARLAEWTAVDLRTGFPEWYRRFQYGPEFQAKILDLVLKLGGAGDEVKAARQELLTIGEPAIPALRAHLGTRNSGLAVQVVDTLMQLGVVPDEVVASHGMWTMSEPSWGLIFDLPQERRAGLRVRMGTAPDSDIAQALAAALEGPAVCVEFLACLAPPPPGQSYPTWRWRFRGACLSRVDAGGPLGERVRALVAAGVADPQVWVGFAEWLIEKGLLTRADVDAWASLPWETAAPVRVRAVRNAKLFQPVEAFEVLREVIAARPTDANSVSNRRPWLFDALAALLPSLPWPESRDDVAHIVGPLRLESARWGPLSAPDDRLLDAFGRAFELARDPNLLTACADVWMQHGPGRPGGIETLFRWAREGALVGHRQRARQALFQRLGERDLDAAVDLLVKPDTVDVDLMYAWQQLFTESPQAGAIVGNPVLLWRLLDRIAAVPQAEHARAEQLSIHLFQPIARGSVPPAALLDPWLEHPERFPPVVFSTQSGNLPKLLSNLGHIPALRRAFRERWAVATPAQRQGLLAGIGVLDVQTDPEMQAFFRQELAAQPRRVPAAWRYAVIARLPKLSIEDVRAYYDLAQPDQVDEAAGWVTRGTPPILEATPQAFEALRLAFRPDGNLANGLVPHFQRIEAVQPALLKALLAHGDYTVRFQGANLLKDRSSPEDAELWIKALADPKASIRAAVAQELRRVPTPATLKALVAALDDPHPDVRAAALDSLDAIQKMEDLKARWREKVR